MNATVELNAGQLRGERPSPVDSRTLQPELGRPAGRYKQTDLVELSIGNVIMKRLHDETRFLSERCGNGRLAACLLAKRLNSSGELQLPRSDIPRGLSRVLWRRVVRIVTRNDGDRSTVRRDQFAFDAASVFHCELKTGLPLRDRHGQRQRE